MSRNSLPQFSVPVPRKAEAGDLEHIPQVKALLAALNDPYVGVATLATLVDGVPILRARCQYAAFMRRPSWRVDNSELVLGVIGNKTLESALFGVLEDLTVLKAELDEARSDFEDDPSALDRSRDPDDTE